MSCPNSDHHLFPASKSEFKHSRNQSSKSSVNSNENSSSAKTFHILRNRPIQPSLATGHYHQESPVAPAFLAPASACHPIRNDRKAFSFRSTCYFGSILKPDILSSLKAQSVLDFHQKSCLMLSSSLALVLSPMRSLRSGPKDFHRVACSNPLRPTSSWPVSHSPGEAQHYLVSWPSLSGAWPHRPTLPSSSSWCHVGDRARWRRCREGFSPSIISNKNRLIRLRIKMEMGKI
jgi:hypothetical protein